MTTGMPANAEEKPKRTPEEQLAHVRALAAARRRKYYAAHTERVKACNLRWYYNEHAEHKAANNRRYQENKEAILGRREQRRLLAAAP